MVSRLLAFIGVACVLTGCFTSSIDGVGGPGSSEPPPECDDDTDCAHFDTDNDVCTRAKCTSGRCERELVKGTAECQCHADIDCRIFETDCSSGKCDAVAHKCSEAITPAGPALESKQRKGDCRVKTCDGVTRQAKSEPELTDVPRDDSNECTVEACKEDGTVEARKKGDGEACGTGGVCFQGKCLPCTPKNPTDCAAEGPGEPSNNSVSTPFMIGQDSPFCAFGSGTDVDWYRFYGPDEELVADIFRLSIWSKAQTVEVCAFAKCDNGQLPDGCSPMIDGPNGARGCCWTGAPSTINPTWDTDCPNTATDSATFWVSVRMPGASTCEPYALSAGY